MRKILILGGTGWLGREIAVAGVAAGYAVTCLARGEAGRVAEGARHIVADRRLPGAYDAVGGEEWDQVVELSWDRDFVETAVAALGEHARQWTLVSSVSVYANNDQPGAGESSAVVEVPEGDLDYAQAKVAAERATDLGDRLLIVRPGLIVGAGDPTDRFGYWPARLAAAREEQVLVLGDDSWVQVIDVSDLAQWIIHAGAQGLTGIVNAVGQPLRFADFLALAAAAVDFRGELVPASDQWLLRNGVDYWAGPRSLPLWLPADAPAFSLRDNAAYLRSGGQLRALSDTLARAAADEALRGLARPRKAGLTRAEEVALLDLL